MYCTDEAPVTKLYQVVYTANYFNFTSDQTLQREAQMHMDGDPNDVLIINTLENTWEKETQPTKVIICLCCGLLKSNLAYTYAKIIHVDHHKLSLLR